MKQRESNIELLRIVAMLMVLIVHADFAALGVPTSIDAHVAPVLTVFRYVWETLSVVCVNVFVLISGWFGIRPNAKSFCKFIFQVLFFSLGVYGVGAALGMVESTPSAWLDMLLCRHGLYWFIPAYVLLYLLAPVLNAYLLQASRKQVAATLVVFYVFQWVYGFAFDEEPIFKFGYSTMSFIGLYLLAQYLRKYCSEYAAKKRLLCFGVYLLCAVVLAGLGFAAAYFEVNGGQIHVIAYNNPIVILESAALLLLFTSFRFRSKAINFVSASAFSVFLLHLNPFFYFQVFKPTIFSFGRDYPAVAAFFLIATFVLGVYVLAILLDQIRILVWKQIEKKCFAPKD